MRCAAVMATQRQEMNAGQPTSTFSDPPAYDTLEDKQNDASDVIEQLGEDSKSEKAPDIVQQSTQSASGLQASLQGGHGNYLPQPQGSADKTPAIPWPYAAVS